MFKFWYDVSTFNLATTCKGEQIMDWITQAILLLFIISLVDILVKELF